MLCSWPRSSELTAKASTYDKDDLRRETVAHLVMALAVSGENDPQVLFNRTLMSLRVPA